MRADSGSAGERVRVGLIGLAVTRPVAVTMIFAAAAVFGLVSLFKLPVDLLPEISYPTITVRTTWAGAAPEDVEDRVSERVQEALSTLPHLVRTSSISRAETSDVVLDFDWGTSMAFAVQEVRDKLDGVFLPDGCDKPLILRYDPNLDPILRLSLTLPESARNRVAARAGDAARAAERELVHLRWLAEERIQREIETLPGVAAVQVRGGLVEEVRVRVDPFRMAAQGLDPAQIGVRLAQENLNASGGLIREGSTEYLVRTQNEFRELEEIGDLAIVRVNGAAVRVRDVAVVERSHAEREVITRVRGSEAVELAIYREAGANIAQVAQRVLERVLGTPAQQEAAERIQKDGGGSGATFEERSEVPQLAFALRDEVAFATLSDQSTFIRDSIDDVKGSALLGVLLTVIVIRLALRAWLPTLVISVSIPISVVVTFAPMYMSGTTLNIMSLGGLALGIGMVVDASIVVLESIAQRRDAGDGIAQAAVRGTREVMGSITGSTLTSVAVFAPIVFVHGVAGRVFGDQALTVVSSLAASLLVAAILIPMLASRRAAPAVASAQGEVQVPARALRLGSGALALVVGLVAWSVKGLAKVADVVLWPVTKLHDLGWSRVERAYPRILGSALRAPWIVLACAALLAAFAATRASRLGLDLLPQIHQGEFTAHVGLEVGTPLETTDAVLTAIERDVRAMDGVALTALVVGVEKDTLTREIEGKNTARLTVRLAGGLANARDERRIENAVRARIASDAAVRSLEFSRPTPFALDAPVQIEVLGYDLVALRSVGAEVAQRLAKVEGLSDVRASVRPGYPEARVTFDREKTLEYGLDLAQTSKLVREQVLGAVDTRFVEGDERIDVRVIGDEIVLGRLDRVLDLVVNPAAATPVRLRDVARVEIVQGPAEIRRVGNTRAVLVTAATSGVDLGGTTTRIEKALAGLHTPDDVVVQLGGQKREMDEARTSLLFALILAVFLVYAVMAAQFESLVQPLIVLLAVPLAGIGVVFALDAASLPVSVVVFIGLILLAGIVVNNAIVLIDRVNQTRALGVALDDALLESARSRLRPIYMTTITTVLGMLPLAGWLPAIPGIVSTGAGTELRAPMAITVIAGLGLSTLLTLLVIPCAYQLVYARADRSSRAAA